MSFARKESTRRRDWCSIKSRLNSSLELAGFPDQDNCYQYQY
jgi:hypothetical protein